MKPNKFIVLILLFFCGCASDNTIKESSLTVFSDACLPSIDDGYAYPVMPEMEEQLTSEDVFKLVQLPDDVLKSISTSGLIDALVNSPLFTGFYRLSSSSSPVDTWHRHYERFNCAKELFERKDAGNMLAEYYRAVHLDCLKSFEENDYFKLLEMRERIFGLEYLFTKQEILDKLSRRKKQEVVEVFLVNIELDTDSWTRFIPMARIMLDDQYAPLMEYCRNNIGFEQSIVSGYVSFSIEQEEQIVSLAKKFIDK